MSPQRWIVAGWTLLVCSAVLAGASLVLVLGSVESDVRVLPAGSAFVDVRELLIGAIVAVCAGVAFFSGLFCFLWSALARSRRQSEELLEALRSSR